MISSRSTPGETLRDLYRGGHLAARYPQVRELLSGLAEAELPAAGHLLSRLDPAEVLRAHPATTTVTIAITGHGTLDPLVPPLTAQLARHGLLARTHLMDFDSYVADLGDPGSALYAADPDIVLCVLDPMVIFDEVPVPWHPADVEGAAQGKLALIAALAQRYQATGRGTLVLNTLPLPRRFTAQVTDYKSRCRLGAIWREANARLLRLADECPALVVIDLDPIMAEGIAADDPGLSLYARAHLPPDLLAGYAREVGHLARHLRGQTKKALALDLDGTIWGGMLGEDGPEGIEVAESHRGEAFRAFQRVIKQLAAQGVLLAAVSKNDPAPVQTVFREHPAMTLREDDFVKIVASWRPKHDTLAELADSLNISADSFVFADDSPFECGLIRQALPGVAVVELSADPARHVGRLLRDGWFDSRELTAEDRTRAAKYRDELARKDFLDTFDSLQEYLDQLQITMRVVRVGEDSPDAARVSQLSLRTNQFNLTADRLQPAHVHTLAADPSACVMAIRSSDRFGDNGLVGAVIVRRESDEMHIQNFLLSCRVFSRGIEQASLITVLEYARTAGVARVLGSYRATAKNEKVRDFYARNGFVLVSQDDRKMTFCHDLAEIPALPRHICLIERPEDACEHD